MKWSPQRIKALRKAYGETQNEFRVRLGVSLSTLKFWETDGPPGSIACKLLEHLERDLGAGKVIEPVPA